MAQISAANLIWIDLEMTGLDPDTDHIIEIATIVTDSDLNTLAEGPVVAIHQPQQVLDAMDEWNTTHHTESGLVERVQKSTFSAQDAEAQTVDFLSEWVQPGRSPMCGNSICQPEVAHGVVKRGAHLALSDIQDSIDELRYYREHFIRVPA